jgi:hypothetical protein
MFLCRVIFACLVAFGSIPFSFAQDGSDVPRKVTRFQFGNSPIWLDWNGNRVVVWNADLNKMILFVDAYNFAYQPRPGFDGIHIEEGAAAIVLNYRTLLVVTPNGEGLLLPSSTDTKDALKGTIEYTMDGVPVYIFYDSVKDVRNIVLIHDKKIYAVPIKDAGARLNELTDLVRARSMKTFLEKTKLPLIDKTVATIDSPVAMTTKRLTGPGANSDASIQPVNIGATPLQTAIQPRVVPNLQRQFEADPSWDEPQQLVELGFDFLLALYPYGKMAILLENSQRDYENKYVVPFSPEAGLPVSIVHKKEGRKIVVTMTDGKQEIFLVNDLLAKVMPSNCDEGLKPAPAAE